MSGVIMAKKRGQAKPSAGSTRATTVAVRATTEWKEWLDRLAEHERLTVADVIDQALVKYARDKGFPEIAPKR
jgi:hypothetical protein